MRSSTLQSQSGGKLVGSSAAFYDHDFERARCRIWDVQNLELGAPPVASAGGRMRAAELVVLLWGGDGLEAAYR